MEQVIHEYDAKLDARNRVTLRAARYEYYHVKEQPDGIIVMEPRILAKPFEVSEYTLRMMDSSMRNLENGVVSDPVDLSDF